MYTSFATRQYVYIIHVATSGTVLFMSVPDLRPDSVSRIKLVTQKMHDHRRKDDETKEVYTFKL